MSGDDLEKMMQDLINKMKEPDKPSNVTPITQKKQTEVDNFYNQVAKEGTHTHLPMDEPSRIARAQEQGFNTDLTLYHGTGNSDFIRFKTPVGSEPAVFLSDDPKVSNYYTSKGGKQQIIPIWAKMENPKTFDYGDKTYYPTAMSKILKDAKNEGHDSVIIQNIKDIGSEKPQTQYAFFKPENLRAKYGAAFDPYVAPAKAHMLSAGPAKTGEILQGTMADNAKLAKQPGFAQGLKSAANAVKGILAPETMDAPAGRAAASIRQELGRGSTRSAEQGKAALQKFEKQVNELPLQDQLDLMDYLQTRSQRNAPVPEWAPMLDTFRDKMLKVRAELETMPKFENTRFREDYLSQMFKQPEEAKKFFAGGPAKKATRVFSRARNMRLTKMPFVLAWSLSRRTRSNLVCAISTMPTASSRRKTCSIKRSRRVMFSGHILASSRTDIRRSRAG